MIGDMLKKSTENEKRLTKSNIKAVTVTVMVYDLWVYVLLKNELKTINQKICQKLSEKEENK